MKGMEGIADNRHEWIRNLQKPYRPAKTKYQDFGYHLNWNNLFLKPCWIKAFYDVFIKKIRAYCNII